MKFVIAPDSYKETMSAATVAATITEGIKAVFPDAECVEVPMADGGEGTTQSLVDALRGEIRTISVLDALGRGREAHFGWIENEKLAVIEIAQAAGIEHIRPAERNPFRSNSAGVGMMLNYILELGPKRIIIGLGGSATNDGGWGMCHALGIRAYDTAGGEIYVAPLALAQAAKFDATDLDPRWNDVEVILACDVDNPLTGPEGATAVFGPQKGVAEKDIERFDSALQVWGSLLDSYAGEPVSKTPGAGAAGGLGAALMAVFGARAQRGIEVVIQATRLAEKMAGADVVFTGEGAMDFQTKFGKTPWGVMQVARAQGIPTIAITGNLGRGVEDLHENGFAAIIPTVREVGSLQEALAKAQPSLRDSARMACRILAVRKDFAEEQTC